MITFNPLLGTAGTSLQGYFDSHPYTFEEAVARLITVAGEPGDGDGDKVSVQFAGEFNGARFTLYDYKEDNTLHIGGDRGLDVPGLVEELTELLAKVTPTPFTRRTFYDEGYTYGWSVTADTAPDLLAAAKDVVADLKLFVSKQGPGPDKRLAALLAAIAKAEGKRLPITSTESQTYIDTGELPDA